MVNFRARDQQKDSGSPKGEVGEIDTRAPFQSVKAAVSLFGEVSVSKERRYIKRKSSESVLDKETQLLFARRELNKIKQQLGTAETLKARALSELQRAKVTLEDLTTKLTTVEVSKKSAIEAAEAVKNQAKELERAIFQKAVGSEARKRELEQARKEYKTTATELDAAKQELTKIRKDFDAALEAKMDAFQTAGEAQRTSKLKSERVSELSEKIAAMKASTEQLKLATKQAQEEQAKVMAEREAKHDSYKAGKEEAQKKLISLKEEYDPELTRNLEAKLAEKSAEIDVLQEEMRKAHASEMDTVRLVTSDLNEAIKTLEEIVEEENSLRNLVVSLKNELEQVKKEQDKLKEKEQSMETLAKEKESYEQSLKIQQLQLEAKDARREAEETSRKAQELKQEAEKARAVTEEVQKKLELVKKEAEEAKAAEQRAMEEMKILSISNSESNRKIELPVEKFESLSGKVKEYQDLAEKTEGANIVLVEEIRTRKIEADRKVEANMKAIEGIKFATDLALRNAEMADSTKLALQGVLRRWRHEEQKMAS